MKLFLTTLLLLISIGCNTPQTAQNNENIAERSRQVVLRNELIRTVELAQKTEKDGRDLDYLRNSYLPGDKKICQTTAAEKRVKIEDLKAKVEKLPEEYRGKFTPFYDDLEKCFGCEKTAVESCKKARAAINQLIRELFPD